MGWYTPMEFSPSLIGCVISGANHSYELIKKSKECVINIPTLDLADKVVGIGTTSGTELDKFKKFGLTMQDAEHVKAPLIKECYANFECRIADVQMIKKYNYFIFEVIKAHVATAPRYPKTIHYRGEGVFMVSGNHISFRDKLGSDKCY